MSENNTALLVNTVRGVLKRQPLCKPFYTLVICMVICILCLKILLRVRMFLVVGILCSPNRTQGSRKQQRGYLFHTNAVTPHKTSQQAHTTRGSFQREWSVLNYRATPARALILKYDTSVFCHAIGRGCQSLFAGNLWRETEKAHFRRVKKHFLVFFFC